MATIQWKGGASAVAQIVTVTLANDAVVDDVYNIRLDDENGGSTTVSHTATSADETAIAAAIVSACESSSSPLFRAIIWRSSAAVITAEAETDGVPFFLTSTVTGTGTVAVATVTASAGPNDWNTVSNWDTGTKPVDADDVVFADSSEDVLYGLDQSSIDLNSMRVAKTYTGTIGQPANNFHLQIDVSNTSGKLIINGNGRAMMVEGAIDEIIIIGGPQSPSMVSIGAATTAGVLRILGGNVLGTVTVEGSAAVSKIFMNGCPRATCILGAGISGLNEIVVSSGTIRSKSGVEAPTVVSGQLTEPGRMIVSGGTVTMEGQSPVRTLMMLGGTVNWRGSGDLGDDADTDAEGLKLFAGTFSVDTSNVKEVTIVDVEIFGGTFTERSGSGVVTYTNDIRQHGGDLKLDSSSTIGVTR